MLYKGEIEELINSVDIDQLLPEKGDIHGGYVIAKCPFCKKESFIIDINRKIYVCTECGKTGNPINFLMEKSTFQNAIKTLDNQNRFTKIEETENKKEKEDKEFYKLIHQKMMEYYEKNQNKESIKYLKSRKLTDETIKKFRLGYSGPFGGDLYKYLIQSGIDKKKLINSGILGVSEENGKLIHYDKFYNRIMFPIFDSENEIIGFGGRTIGNSKAKYLNSPENVLFHKGENLYAFQIAKQTNRNYLILCEGNVDVIMMHQAGFDNATASLGTALTREQAKLISKYFKKVVIAYDSDAPGQKATKKAIKLLKEFHILVNVLNLSPYKDPDELLKNAGRNEMAKRIRDSIQSTKFECQYIQGLNNMEEKINEIEIFLGV